MSVPQPLSPVLSTKSDHLKKLEDGTSDSSSSELNVNAELAELTVVAEGEERTTLFVWLLVLCCSISGLLFGM